MIPRGSYPAPFLGYLVLWLGSVILKSGRPKKGVGYEPLGTLPAGGTLRTCGLYISFLPGASEFDMIVKASGSKKLGLGFRV